MKKDTPIIYFIANVVKKNIIIGAVSFVLITLFSCSPRLAKPTYRAPNKIAEFDSLMANLEANTYDVNEGESLPDLYWDDIPHLLKIAESDLTLTNFPRNPESSYAQHQAYMGIVAMWMIESIRRDDAERDRDDIQPFPSMNLMLAATNSLTTPEFRPNTFIELRTAAEAYRRWWELYPTVGIDALKKIDPLEGTGLKWN